MTEMTLGDLTRAEEAIIEKIATRAAEKAIATHIKMCPLAMRVYLTAALAMGIGIGLGILGLGTLLAAIGLPLPIGG